MREIKGKKERKKKQMKKEKKQKKGHIPLRISLRKIRLQNIINDLYGTIS